MANEQNKDQTDNKVPLWKKLIIPAGVFLIGSIIVILLIALFVPKANLLSKDFFAIGPTDLPQDSFQAPAEISTVVQMECQAALEKINSMNRCDDQASEFVGKAESCMSYDYVLEKPQTLPSEGQFGDAVFVIAACFQKENPTDLSKAVEFLQKAKSLPDWELTFGTATCDSKSALDAYISSYTSTSVFRCYKPSDESQIIDQINSGNLAVIDELISKQHIPQLGQLETDSEVTCPESNQTIKRVILKALSEKSKIIQNKTKKNSDSTGIYLDIAKDEKNHRALIKLNIDQNGCLFFDSMLASSLDKPEDSVD